jgi:hypothetical protein
VPVGSKLHRQDRRQRERATRIGSRGGANPGAPISDIVAKLPDGTWFFETHQRQVGLSRELVSRSPAGKEWHRLLVRQRRSTPSSLKGNARSIALLISNATRAYRRETGGSRTGRATEGLSSELEELRPATCRSDNQPLGVPSGNHTWQRFSGVSWEGQGFGRDE